MNLSIKQFLGIVLAIVVIYLVYHFWWSDQDNRDWIKGFNTWVFVAEDETQTIEKEPEASGWVD